MVPLFTLFGMTLSLLTSVAKSDPPTVPTDIVLLPPSARMAGEVRTAHLTLSLKGKSAPGPVVVKEVLTTTLQTSRPDGTLTLVNRFEAGTATVNGREIDILKALPVVTVTRSIDGLYTSTAEGGSVEGNGEVSGVLTFLAAATESLLPRHAVKTGERWKIAYANPNVLQGGPKLTGEAELVGMESLHGVDTFKIKFKADGGAKTASGTTHVEGTLNVSAKGAIVRITQQGAGRFANSDADDTLEVTFDETQKNPVTKEP